jgi:hypothetical protein
MYKILNEKMAAYGDQMIVTVAVETNIGWKAYQGVEKPMQYTDDELLQRIAGFGTKLTPNVAKAYFPNLDPGTNEN